MGHLKKYVAIAVLPAWALVSICSVSGCAAGHGRYTTEGMNLAQERMATMKSGADWDMARHQFLVGDLQKALKSVKKSLAINDSVAKSQSLHGRILFELGQLEGALESFKKSIAIDPSFVEAYYYQGVVYERYGETDKALEQYQAAAALDPSNPQYAIASAEMLIDLDRLDEAEETLDARGAHFEHNAGVRQTLGHLAMMRGDAAKAVEFFSSARLLDPADSAILEDLAVAQMTAGSYAQAEYTLRELLRQKEYATRRDLKQLRARCLVTLDRPVEAREILLGLSRDGQGVNDVEVWVDLGDVALMLNDYHRVRIAAGRIVALDSQRFEGPLLSAMWQRQQGDLKGALKNARLSMSLAQDANVTPALVAGSLLRALGRSREAESIYMKALSMDPTNPRTQYLLAEVNSAE